MSVSPRVWLITGTSTGIGRELVFAGLRRGEKVIATARARSLELLADLEHAGAAVLELDVTAPLEVLHEIAKKAVEIYGHVDVLVNNAGASIAIGALEEISPEDTMAQFNVNLFGALNVSRAFLPFMRARKSGLIIWNGSMFGWEGTPACGVYCATKYAMRGISETLDKEVSQFRIRSIVIEPGFFRTEATTIGHRSAYENRIADYAPMMGDIDKLLINELAGKQPGDSSKLAELVVDIATQAGGAQGKPLPVALPIGPDAYRLVEGAVGDIQERLALWKDVVTGTNHPDQEGKEVKW